MPNPTRSDVHISVPLTNLSVAFIQKSEDFIADTVFPPVPVDKQADKYYVFPKDNWFRSSSQKRSAGSESAGGGYNLTTDNYSCDVIAVHKDVSDQVRANSDSVLSPDRTATRFVTQQNLLRKELDWQTKYFTNGVWGADFTPSILWDAANSIPIQDIKLKIRAIRTLTGFTPNTLTLSPDVLNVLENHDDIMERIKYTQRGVVSLDLLANLFGVSRVLEAKAIKNTAAEGQSAAMSDIFTKHALLTYAPSAPALEEASAGYTFNWKQFSGAKDGTRIKKFRMEHLESDRIEGEMAYDQKIVAADCGIFFENVIS